MSRTIANTITTGVSLASGDNPLTITATGRVSAANTYAIFAEHTLTAGWTVSNFGTIVETGSDAAVRLQSYVHPDSFTNQSGGLITSTYTGVQIDNGGVLINQVNATISSTSSNSYASAISMLDTGTVINSGLLRASYLAIYEKTGGSVTNFSTGTINGGGGVYLKAPGTVTNAGTIIGSKAQYGAVDFASNAASNRLIVDPGAVFSGKIISQANSTNVIELAAGSGAGSLSGFDGSGITNFATLQFDAGTDWTVTGNTAASGLGSIAITGFTIGDTIDLTGFVAVSKTFANNALVLTNASNAHATLHIQGDLSSGNFGLTNPGGNSTALVGKLACFAEGTAIATPDGHCPIEALQPGDLVRTASGDARPVRWVGFRALDLTGHPAPEQAQPIRIAAGAFADNVPSRDLLLSPDHAVLRDGLLIPVKLLRNDASIARETDCRRVTYYHVELDTHDILLAEGLAAESYIDTGNRGIFQNADGPLNLHPAFDDAQAQREAASCAPFAADPARVEPIWHALAARAAAGGLAMPDTSPHLRLIAACQTIQPFSQTATCAAFLLPASTGPVRLISSGSIQPWIDDPRSLGVAVTKLTLRSGSAVETLALDHPSLGNGWWDPERDGERMWRWTDGDATIALNIDRAAVLEVQFAVTAPARHALLVA
jgi:Hint domain